MQKILVADLCMMIYVEARNECFKIWSLFHPYSMMIPIDSTFMCVPTLCNVLNTVRGFTDVG